MKLNAELIFEELSKNIELRKSGPARKEEHLRRPMLYFPGMKLQADHIYVARSDSLPTDTLPPSRCCIFSVGEPPTEYLSSNANIIHCSSRMDIGLVMNMIQAVFDQLEDWDLDLDRCVSENRGFQEMLDISQPFFGKNFLLVLDMNYRVLATTSEPDYVMDRDGRTPISVLARFKADPEYIKMRLSRETFLYKGKYFDHDILSNHIYLRDELWGGVSLAATEEAITNGRWTIFEHLVSKVKQYYQQNVYLFDRRVLPISTLFVKLLNGESLHEDELFRMMSRAGWKDSESYAICYVSVHEIDKRISSIPYICRQIESLLVHAFAFEYNTDIVVVLNCSKLGSAEDITGSEFRTFLKKSSFQAGISKRFLHLINLKSYYIQASYALELGKKYAQEETIYHFQQYILQYMLDRISEGMEPLSLCAPSILRLRDMDRFKGTSYIETLDTYFALSMNATHASRHLYISRSTFLERLERIKQQLEGDLDDPDHRLYLMLSLRLLHHAQDTSAIKNQEN